MSSWMFLKIFGDACLYFSVIGAFPVLFPCRFSFLVPAVLCGLGPGAAAAFVNNGKIRYRYVGLAISALSLVLVRSFIDFLVLIPMLIYCGAVISRCDFYLEYYNFRHAYLRILLVLTLGVASIGMFHSLEISFQAKEPVLEAGMPLWYGLLYALTGVILCRMLRMGTGIRVRGAAGLLLSVVGVGVLVVGLIFAEWFLSENASSLSALMIGGVIAVLGVPGQLLNKLIEWFMSLPDKGYQEILKDTMNRIEEARGSSGPTEETVQRVMTETEDRFPWWAVVLVLSILAIGLILLLRQLRGDRPDGQGGDIQKQITSKKEKAEKDRRSNRAKVRHYYRQFLRGEKRRGLRLRKDQTSKDILDALPRDTDRIAAEELRQIYLAARYDETRKVTREQAEAAKEALKRIQNK